MRWTRSHQLLEKATSAYDAWCIFHNSCTDRLADVNVNPLPVAIQSAFDQLVEQNTLLEKTRNATMNFLKTIWAAHADAGTSDQTS